MRSGIPELVRDGVNGYLVPVGDIEAFVDRLTRLQQDLHRRRKMSVQAHVTMVQGACRTEDMAQMYTDLFGRVSDKWNRGLFKRPPGMLIPPPAQVDGINVFPVKCWARTKHGEFVCKKT